MDPKILSEPNHAWRPFVRLDRWGPVNTAMTYFLAVFLLPVRLFALFALLTWYRLIAAVGLIGVNNYSDRTADWRRRWFVETAQPVCRLLFIFLGFWKIDIKGNPSMKDAKGQANVIIMNHLSWLDILLMMAVADDIPGFVAKVETKKIPYIGVKSQIWQCLYVENRVGSNAAGVAQLISERAKRDDMPPIVCFPEGTTSNGQYVISFRSGAFVGGHPVKPCALRYPFSSFSPTWETIGGVTHIIRLLTQWSNRAEVHWLPVYHPSAAEKADPKLYANNVRQVLAKELSIPTIESSFTDKVEYHVSKGYKKAPAASKKVE